MEVVSQSPHAVVSFARPDHMHSFDVTSSLANVFATPERLPFKPYTTICKLPDARAEGVDEETLSRIFQENKRDDTREKLFKTDFFVRMFGVSHRTKLVGCGFQGSVFRLLGGGGFKTAGDGEAVVKVFTASETAQRESIVLKKLHGCTHVVQVLGTWMSGIPACIVMEDGGVCLFDVREDVLGSAETVCSQMVIGLRHMHEKSVAWRDLKLDNMLWNPETRCVKFCDMGLAHIMTEDERQTRTLLTHCGSISYAAPEILSKDAYNGMEVDVWSLGITIVAFLFGAMPFHQASRKCPYYLDFVNETRTTGRKTPHEWIVGDWVGFLGQGDASSVPNDTITSWLPGVVNGFLLIDPSSRRRLVED